MSQDVSEVPAPVGYRPAIEAPPLEAAAVAIESPPPAAQPATRRAARPAPRLHKLAPGRLARRITSCNRRLLVMSFSPALPPGEGGLTGFESNTFILNPLTQPTWERALNSPLKQETPMSFTGKATYTAGPDLPEIAEDIADLVVAQFAVRDAAAGCAGRSAPLGPFDRPRVARGQPRRHQRHIASVTDSTHIVVSNCGSLPRRRSASPRRRRPS